MTANELERMIRIALRHKCGVTHLEPGEAATLAVSLSTATSVDIVAASIAAHASRRSGDNVIDLRQPRWRRDIREMFEGFVALRESLHDTRTTG